MLITIDRIQSLIDDILIEQNHLMSKMHEQNDFLDNHITSLDLIICELRRIIEISDGEMAGFTYGQYEMCNTVCRWKLGDSVKDELCKCRIYKECPYFIKGVGEEENTPRIVNVLSTLEQYGYINWEKGE